ncbi:hypothetical protein WJX72_001378 [[Myrmecia] bisecta]|uniref:Uncharacterized protein n=1 Tax=[Myrmecia] bisecta TaxID=41462 RepID=A0AAW1R3W2_9CHLO
MGPQAGAAAAAAAGRGVDAATAATEARQQTSTGRGTPAAGRGRQLSSNSWHHQSRGQQRGYKGRGAARPLPAEVLQQ